MRQYIYSIDELRQILCPIFIRYDIRRAVLFGSYGKAAATETSDVDLLVDSRLRGLHFVGMIEDIREALDKDVDILDVSHICPQSRIDQEIHNTGVLLYEKSDHYPEVNQLY